MATYKYKHAVKVNGRIVPPNTEIEDGAAQEAADAEKSEETAKKRGRRSAAKSE
jgi:hypothetical protein